MCVWMWMVVRRNGSVCSVDVWELTETLKWALPCWVAFKLKKLVFLWILTVSWQYLYRIFFCEFVIIDTYLFTSKVHNDTWYEFKGLLTEWRMMKSERCEDGGMEGWMDGGIRGWKEEGMKGWGDKGGRGEEIRGWQEEGTRMKGWCIRVGRD